MDVTDIEAGVDFVDVLQGAVGSCGVLLAVIGHDWLTCTDRSGRRRLDDERDFIRLEIGTALARNVRVIPVLVEGVAMPTAQDLPADLEGLTRRQAVELRDARWNADVESLTSVLAGVMARKPGGRSSVPPEHRPPKPQPPTPSLPGGTRVFESKDTIRAALMGNTIAASAGQLVAPFVSKIAERLVDSDWPASVAPQR